MTTTELPTTKPRLFGIMPVYNEVHRYLKSAVTNALTYVDALFVYDDRSTDYSVTVARELGAVVEVRPRSVPGFLQHEGRFRQAAWDAFQATLLPTKGDWVIAIDADEALVTKAPDIRAVLDDNIASAERRSLPSCRIQVPEIFGFDTDGTPLNRVDGYWGSIAGTRLFKYLPSGIFRDKPMGCGSEPIYVSVGSCQEAKYLWLMHFGYANEQDQIDKHARYTSLLAHGHDGRHIESIVGHKQLRRWDGPIPSMVRGDR